MMNKAMNYKIIVIGTSAGGLNALSILLSKLHKDFPLPILVVQHLLDDHDSYLPEHLARLCEITVKQAQDKEKISNNTIYVAPPGYHLEVDDVETLSLSFDPRVNYSRPSIDVLFESTADVFQQGVIGVILTGANADGTSGIQRIKQCNGTTIAQDPTSAKASMMPQSAIDSGCIDMIMPLENISAYITGLVRNG
jgi:two-component system, chemotaxis family, protein-glutamate methylesterase/glutaminase